ncbi:Uncharacterised protein [uncultured Ruminococcus sp.]|nr:Uncharacterised protein [uncultured Ruminococcus sp.]
MKKRIISMLLAGMMVLNSAVVYADADMTGDYTTYVEETESGSEDEVAVQSEAAEVNASADDNANISVNEASEAENDEVAFTDGDTDEVEITEENPTDVSSQDETDENAEIEFTEAEDIFSENEVAVQTGETITASGTLATGVNWSLSDAGNLQFSGSGAIEKDNGQDNYPWDMTQVFTVTIQSGITEIGSGAFADGTKLTKVFISADTLRTVSADAFQNCSKAETDLYYSGNAPTVIPAFTGTAKVSVYYKEADVTWTDAFRAAYTDVTWEPCCTINGITANTNHSYVRTNNEMQIQTDGKNYPTKDNTAYYDATCSVCGNVGKDYNNCINCIDTTDLQSDHPYNTETSTDWTVSMEGAEEIILTFDAKTKFETNYDDFFYIYKEDGELYQKFINDQLAGKTVIVPGSSATLKLTTDYSTDDWGFAVTKAYGTTHKWNNVVTKPAERDQTGTLTKTCQKCGEVIEEVIPAPYIVCGDDDNIFWGITPDGVLEIAPNTDADVSMKGYGTRYEGSNYGITTAPWGEYRPYFKGVKIKKGITDIGTCVFSGLSNLKWAELDDGIKTIGQSAFSDCKVLEKVKLPANLATIESYVFSGCKTLEKIELPEKLTYIGNGAFSDTGLRSIRIPASLKRCDKYAFGSNSTVNAVYIEDLTSWLSMEEGPNFFSSEDIELSSKSPTIKYYVDGELLERLVIPDEVTSIRDYAFNCGKEIREIVFHENVKTIGRSAFLGCENLELTRDKLPNYLQTIGAYAFAKCKKISKVGIPSSVTEIGEAAFAMCSGMTQCIFAQEIQIEKISRKLFQGCTSLEKTTIPAGVTIIEGYAFQNCKKLDRITIPATVISILSEAFYSCTNLEAVEFEKDSKLKNIEDYVFAYCDSLKSIQIPANVITIKLAAFCGSVDELVFLGDFGNFNSMLEMDFHGPRKITYYACNDTWNSSEAQNFLSNSSYNITPNPIHMSEDYTVITPATCTTDGEKSFTCDKCGQASTGVIPATGHKLTVKDHKDATCNEKGYDVQVCSVCNEEIRTELEIDLNAHKYDEGKVIEPTCSRDGYTVYTCAVCRNTKRENIIPRKEHVMEDIVVPATCQIQGYTRHQCKNCDYTYYDTYTDPLEHDYEATVKAPACTERGYTVYTCKNCGYTYTDNYVGASGHKYTKKVVAPTCVSRGYTENICDVCGNEYVSDYKSATGHTYKRTVKDPTCTEEGYTLLTCENCDYETKSDIRRAKGHNYEETITESTCTTKGFITYTCTDCGDSYKGKETDLAPHKWDKGTVTKQATYLSKGTIEYKCADCDAKYTEEIPMSGQTALSDCTVTLSYHKTAYDGKEKTPKITVKNSNGIVSEEDYTVTYADNVNAGNAKVIITAKTGDVSIKGTVEKGFTIAKAKQAVSAASTDEQIHVKASTEIQADGIGDISLKNSTPDLVDINETTVTGKKAGLALIKVTVSGDANHEEASTMVAVGVNENHVIEQMIENQKTLENGDVEYDEVQRCTLCEEEISRTTRFLKNIKSCEVKLAASTYIYDGKEVKPEVTVLLEDTTLSEGTDYRLEYQDNNRVGEASVSVTGIGNYTDTKTVSFQIVEKQKEPVTPVVEKLDTVNITSIANAKKGIKLTWNRVSGAQGYIIYRAYGKGGYKAIKTVTNGATAAYTDTGAKTNGGKYTYAVCAYKGSIKGAYVGKTYYYLKQNRISSVKNNASKKATVKWTRNTKANGYQVNYKTGKKQKTITVKSNKTLNKVLKSLKKKATYSVKVRSYKKVSGVTYYSEWSSAKKVKIKK